jgi:hypothetical protein
MPSISQWLWTLQVRQLLMMDYQQAPVVTGCTRQCLGTHQKLTGILLPPPPQLGWVQVTWSSRVF